MKMIKGSWNLQLWLVLLCCLFLPAMMLAQSAGSGSITGTVSDPSGAVVAGASVAVRNADTGIVQTVVTNAAGSYLAPFLQPGRYELSIEKQGFTRSLRKGIEIQVGRTVTLNIALRVSSTEETVNVTGEAPALDTSKVEVSEELDRNAMENLPMINRRWDNFVLTTPAASPDGGLVSYRGVSGMYNLNMVDGANNNQAFFSEARGRSLSPYGYSMDTIEEFQVNTSNYSAEFGQAAGGIVNAVSKSGTNNIHGDLFYFLRYPALNALDPYSKSQGIHTQAIHQQQDFGGSVGGPIQKDKLFYFLSYNGFRRSFPVTYTSTNATKTSFNPSNSPSFACPALAGAAVTAAQCTSIQNFVESELGSNGRVGNQDVVFSKVDYQLDTKDHLSANFNWNNYQTPNGYSSGSTYNNSSLSTNGAVNFHNRFLVANWSRVISNSMVNKFLFQWGRDLETDGDNAGGPSVNVTNLIGYGMPNALPRPAFPDEHRYQFSDTLSQTYGRHQLKYGVDVNFIHELLINLYEGGGLYNYTGNVTEYTAVNKGGTKLTLTPFQAWAMDVVGAADSNYLADNSNPTGRHFLSFAQVTDPITHVGKDDFYNDDLALFAEDSWKITPDFTLNLGIRYDLQEVPQPPRPNTFDALTTEYTSKIHIPKTQFAPRIGFSYAANESTIFRGGFGMFYAKTSNSTFYAIRVENGVYQQTFNCNPTTCPALDFPNVIYTPPGPTPTAPFAGALAPQVTSFTPPAGTQLAHGLDRNFVNPVVYESNFAMENRLPGNVIFTVEGLSSRGQHLPVFVDANLEPATATHTYAIMSPGGTSSSPATQVTTVTVPWYSNSDANKGRIDPNMGVVLIGKSTVKSWYNAFVASARKPFSKGLEAQFYYTWGKSLDTGAVAGQYGTFYGTDSPVDPANQKAEKGPSDIDQRHRFTGQILYKPTFKVNGKALNYVANGWTASMNFTLATGQPLSATVSGYPSGGPDGGVTGAEVSNAGIATGGRPPQFMRNAYHLSGMKQVDIRMGRDLPITERLKMQVLAEAFNLFNSRNVFGENSTAYSFNSVGGNAALCPSTLTGVNGCLNPSPTFQAISSTSSTNSLYSARQLQMSAKIIF